LTDSARGFCTNNIFPPINYPFILITFPSLHTVQYYFSTTEKNIKPLKVSLSILL
jgi:hypothetical protein